MNSICANFGTDIGARILSCVRINKCMKRSETHKSFGWSLLLVIMCCTAGVGLSAQPDLLVKLKDSTYVTPARPLDTVFYNLEIKNLSAEDIRNLILNRSGDPNTSLIPGSFQSTPVAVPANISTLLEDQPDALSIVGFDLDGDALTFAIAQNPMHGTLSGLTVLSAIEATINYQPNDHFNGTDEFTFFVTDDDGNRDTSLFKIAIQPVNDAPAFTATGEISIFEDGGAQTIPWATDISAGPADERVQALTFNILNNSNPDLFATQPQIAEDGALTFEAEANANGVVELIVQLMDDGGTANGGVDTSLRQILRIAIQPVNDAPAFTKGSDISMETTTDLQTFANWATDLIAGPPDEASQLLSFVIESIDNQGLFELLPQIAADGTLTFKANPDAVGSATVVVKLMDDGGIANGGVNTSETQSFVIELTPSGG